MQKKYLLRESAILDTAQGWETVALDIHFPEEFSSNTDKTHMHVAF